MPKMTEADAARLRVKYERMSFAKLRRKLIDVRARTEQLQQTLNGAYETELRFSLHPELAQDLAQHRQWHVRTDLTLVYWTVRKHIIE